MAVGTPVVGALNEQTSAGTTTTIAFPATVAAGAVAYLFLTVGASGLTTNPAGWTQLANLSGTGGTANPSNYVGRKVCVGTEGGTSVVVTHANAVNSGIIVVVPTGVDTGTPEDVATVNQDNTTASTAVTNAGATVVTANSLGLYFTGNNTTANTSTQTAGYTALSTRSAGNRAFEVSYKNSLATGATGALSDTYSGSGKSVTSLVIVRASVQATFASANNTAFTKGSAGTFTVTVTGASPVAVLTKTGTLPTGVTFTDNGNNTATLAGTPTQSGSFPLTLTATNAGGAPTQSFTLTVNDAPAITSATTSSGTQSSAYSFTITTTGYPVNTITESGTLPTGVTLTDNHDNTATLAGTPSNSGPFAITITAHNGIGSDATQSHTITITSSFTPLASEELDHALNRCAGTTGLAVAGAANAWAGTTGLELVAALNHKNGTTTLGLQGVLNALAGTTNTSINGCARLLH